MIRKEAPIDISNESHNTSGEPSTLENIKVIGRGIGSALVNSIPETLKLRAEEKWDMLRSRIGAKVEGVGIAFDKKIDTLVINRDKRLGNKVDQNIAWYERKIAQIYKNREVEEAKFSKAMEGVKDPDLIALFEKNKSEKLRPFNTELGKFSADLESERSKRRDIDAKIVENNEKIRSAGQNFEDKIDDAIENVRGHYGYKEKKAEIADISADISEAKDVLSKAEATISEYRSAIESSVLDKESVRRVKGLLKEYYAKKATLLKQISGLEKKKHKIEKYISKIDRKTDKWETLRKKYGLGKNNNKDINISNQNTEEGGGVASIDKDNEESDNSNLDSAEKIDREHFVSDLEAGFLKVNSMVQEGRFSNELKEEIRNIRSNIETNIYLLTDDEADLLRNVPVNITQILNYNNGNDTLQINRISNQVLRPMRQAFADNPNYNFN